MELLSRDRAVCGRYLLGELANSADQRGVIYAHDADALDAISLPARTSIGGRNLLAEFINQTIAFRIWRWRSRSRRAPRNHDRDPSWIRRRISATNAITDNRAASAWPISQRRRSSLQFEGKVTGVQPRNGTAIRKVCARFVELCREMGLLAKASVAIDGSKFKAVNNRDRNFEPRGLGSQRLRWLLTVGTV